jgi:hypothetical protein
MAIAKGIAYIAVLHMFAWYASMLRKMQLTRHALQVEGWA